MNTISIIICKPKFASSEQPVLAVDGMPLYDWIKTGTLDDDGNDTASSLVPAQTWLHDPEHARIAWKLLAPADESATVVPLLVCPDDMDLNCTVIVAEQVVDKLTVEWRRFGYCTDHIHGVVTSVSWFKSEQSACFNRAQFEDAYFTFKRLSPDY